jgi:allantoin racemase
MKIRVIIPNSSEPFRAGQEEDRKKAASAGVEVEVVCLQEGPESIESALDEALAGPHIIGEVVRAAQEGCDAVSLDCAMDTVVRAAREAVDIPVVSAGEASHLLALGLARRFSIVTVMDSTAEAIRENLAKTGLDRRAASVRAAHVPVLELADQERAFTAILAQARLALEEDGAQAIVLGCTGMSQVAARLQKELGVPVIDPAEASIQLAEVYVRMGLSGSRAAYGPGSGADGNRPSGGH